MWSRWVSPASRYNLSPPYELRWSASSNALTHSRCNPKTELRNRSVVSEVTFPENIQGKGKTRLLLLIWSLCRIALLSGLTWLTLYRVWQVTWSHYIRALMTCINKSPNSENYSKDGSCISFVLAASISDLSSNLNWHVVMHLCRRQGWETGKNILGGHGVPEGPTWGGWESIILEIMVGRRDLSAVWAKKWKRLLEEEKCIGNLGLSLILNKMTIIYSEQSVNAVDVSWLGKF